MPVGQFGDVHQALDALLDPDERAERDKLGDPAGHDLPDLVGPGELLPRVFLGGLQRQRDALAVHVHVQHLDGDLLAHLDASQSLSSFVVSRIKTSGLRALNSRLGIGDLIEPCSKPKLMTQSSQPGDFEKGLGSLHTNRCVISTRHGPMDARRRTVLMGIINVTPDSFYDGGRRLDPDRAVADGIGLVEAGADVIDIGGESTRPGAGPVSLEEELQRVLPVIRGLRRTVNVPISIDTYKAPGCPGGIE